jgi:hypothetical protein
MMASDTQLWLATQVVDYAACCLTALTVSMLFDETVSATKHTPLRLAASCAFLGLASVMILHCREWVHFSLLGSRLPACKNQKLAKRTHWYIFQTATLSMVSYFTMTQLSCIYYTPPTLTSSFWLSTFAPFYSLLALRDVFFLWPLHPTLHSPRWYHLHKLHHEPTKSAQSLHAFYIDLIDLLIENVGAPLLLFLAQFVLGRPVGIHWYVGVLLTCHDGALHSVNPFSVMLFNPILDALFKGNVAHQLHHALNTGYYLFVPWRHVRSSRRAADCRRYNAVFKTDFALCRGLAE